MSKPVIVKRNDEMVGAFFPASPYYAKSGPGDTALNGAKEWVVCDRRECTDGNPDGQVAGAFLSIWAALSWIEAQTDGIVKEPA